MSREQQINELIQAEAVADLMIMQGRRMKNECHKARQKLEGVSTPSSARKGRKNLVTAQAVAGVVARRNARILKSASK